MINLTTERMCHAGSPRPKEGEGFGRLLQNGFYINYLHGLNYLCKKYITKNTKILELGCFYGVSSSLFSEYSDDITCVDIMLYPEMQKVIENTKINFHKSDSIEFLNSCDNETYDLIYIDTTHDYGRTKEEIILAYNKIKPNGYLAGHDYNTDGVSNAILSIFKYPDIEIFLDSSWLIQKTII
jgi:predicted O-methyltransferase YrrM